MLPSDINPDAAKTPESAAVGESHPGTLIAADRVGGAMSTFGPSSAEVTPRPEILYSTPNVVDLLRAFQRRWFLALFVGLVLASAGVAYMYFTVPVYYNAIAQVRISERKPEVLFVTRQRTFEGIKFINNQKQLIASYLVLEAVLNKEIKVNNNTIKIKNLRHFIDDEGDLERMSNRLRQSITLGFYGGSDILNIQVRSQVAQEATILANAIKNSYLTEVVEVDRQKDQQKLERLKRLFNHYWEKYTKIRARYEQMNRDFFGISSQPLAQMLKALETEKINELQKSVGALSKQVYQLEMRIGQEKTRQAANASGGGDGSIQINETPRRTRLFELTLAEVVSRDVELLQLRRQMEALDLLILQEREKAVDPESEESITVHESKRKELQSQIDNRKIVLQSQVSDIIGDGLELSTAEELEQEKKQKELDLSVLKKELVKRLETLEQYGYSDNLDNLRAERDQIKGVADRFRSAVQREEVEKAAKPRVESFHDAAMPRIGTQAQKYKTMRNAGIGCFCLGILGVCFFEFLARRITSPVEMSEGLGLRVMGNIPLLTDRSWRRRIGLKGASEQSLQFLARESMDSIRESMLHGSTTDALRVVMIVSALQREGKSTVASQLAASLARSGRRTLLFDGDMRRPSAHTKLEMPLEKGLSELLRGEAELSQVIRPTEMDGLWLLSAGHPDPSSVQALAKGGLKELFENLREEFDFIVVDSTPVLEVPDALSLGQFVDGAILTVRYQVSKMSRVFEAMDRLQAVGVRIEGCVVNGKSTGRIGKYNYGYDYGYYQYDYDNHHASGENTAT